MNRSKAWGLMLMVCSVVLALLSGCSEMADPLERKMGADDSACLECHTSQARLEATAEPDTSGGEPPGQG